MVAEFDKLRAWRFWIRRFAAGYNALEEGEENLWRVHVGDWCIGYEIDDAAREVTIIRIGHRREFYD